MVGDSMYLIEVQFTDLVQDLQKNSNPEESHENEGDGEALKPR
jgi:hypothetical protein